MAGSRNKKKAQENRTPVQFDDKDSRVNFIQERMDSLLDEFGQSYGSFLAEELQKRLDYTMKIFHEDATELLTGMVIESNARMEMNNELRQGKRLEELVGKPMFQTTNTRPTPPQAPSSIEKKEINGTRDKTLSTDRVGNSNSLFRKKSKY